LFKILRTIEWSCKDNLCPLWQQRH